MKQIQNQRPHFRARNHLTPKGPVFGRRTTPLEQPDSLRTKFRDALQELKKVFPDSAAIYKVNYNHPDNIGTTALFRVKGDRGVQLRRVREGKFRDVDNWNSKLRSKDKWSASYGQIKASYLGKPVIQDLWVEPVFEATGMTATGALRNLLPMLDEKKEPKG